MSLPKNFYDDVERPGSLKHVLYSDTDSCFVVVPAKDIKNMPAEKRIEIGHNAAVGINEAITKYLNEFLLPKSNISTQYNRTSFKEEFLIDSILFLDVKKNYAYKCLAREGKIFEKPEIKYTGIQVVKSDAAKMTQNILKTLIEDVLLNTEVKSKERLMRVTKAVSDYHEQFQNMCNEFELNDIGFPAKWSKKENFINGMMLYNYIMKEEVFSMSSSGKFIYCNFRNTKTLHDLPNLEKTKGICVPFSYNKELVKAKLEEFQIEIDRKTQFEKIFSTTCQRVVDLVRQLNQQL